MSPSTEDLQMLRLIKAFQQIADKDARRLAVLFAEEQLEKQKARERGKPERTE